MRFKSVALGITALLITANAYSIGIYQENYTYPASTIVNIATTDQFVIDKENRLFHGCRSFSRPSPPAPSAQPTPMKKPAQSLRLQSLFLGNGIKSILMGTLKQHGVEFNQPTKTKTKGSKEMKAVATVHFPINVYTLTDEQKAHLLGELQHYKNRLLYIEGFTDCTGSREYNDNLANDRAKSVADFLKKHGFKVKAMQSWGKYQTLKTDKASRRAVIYVTEIKQQ